MEALLSRAEVRDFVDVDALIQVGYSRERLIELQLKGTQASKGPFWLACWPASVESAIGSSGSTGWISPGSTASTHRSRTGGMSFRARTRTARVRQRPALLCLLRTGPSTDSTAPSSPVPPATGAPRRERQINVPDIDESASPGDHNWLRSLVRVNLLLWEVLSACGWMTLVISQGRKTLRRQPGTWGGCGDRANRGDRRCGSHP